VNPLADIVIRRATTVDGPAIEAMFARCSVESRYARFLAPLPTIPAGHLARVLGPSLDDRSWVGVRRDRSDTVLALGSWSRVGTDAELALIVEDAWQRRGIGSKFLRMLAETAWNAGVCRLTASVLTESRHVLRMLRAIAGPLSVRADGPVSHVTVDRCDDPP
jgi:GNAT superfamily N-acetyltransferase